ncbi:hypothetical protein J3D56_000849 [Erwinia persicina]|uniref:hypothetical protein n=1 Tax=Erwinia persicina TaxID=55211 RepID=UPI00209F2FA5|nr:hypothetical protein [Erwinia persicina]MCP1437413.1 hypothetical protein [Erwinia persicina]
MRDGVLHRGTLRICNFSKSLDNDIDVSPAGGFIDFLKGMDVIKEEYAKKGFVKKNRALFLYNEGLVDKNSTLLLARKGDRVLGTIGVIREKIINCRAVSFLPKSCRRLISSIDR